MASLSQAVEAKRDTREVEGLLEAARRLTEVTSRAIARTNDMKHRLLGMSEPTSITKDQPPQPKGPELTELRVLLSVLEAGLDKVHENITTLERI